MQTIDEVDALERADRLLSEDGVSGDRGGIAAMILEAVQHEREACAKIIDDHAEGSHGNVRVLVERTEGNLAGTAYATAIRARSTLSK